MRVTPVTPVMPLANDTRPARQYGEATPRQKRANPATAPYARASVVIELYGNPAMFGSSARYGTFSEKV
jgi:hypothetical protein